MANQKDQTLLHSDHAVRGRHVVGEAYLCVDTFSKAPIGWLKPLFDVRESMKGLYHWYAERLSGSERCQS